MGHKSLRRAFGGKRLINSHRDFERGKGVFNLTPLPDEPLIRLCTAAALLLDPVPAETAIRVASSGNTKRMSGLYDHSEAVNIRWLRGQRYRFEKPEYYLCDGFVECSLEMKTIYSHWRLVNKVAFHEREYGASVQDVMLDQSVQYAHKLTRLIVHELTHASDDRAGLYFQSYDPNVTRRSKWADREEEQRAEAVVRRLCGCDGLNMGEFGEWVQPHPDLEGPMLEVANAIEGFLWDQWHQQERMLPAANLSR